MSSVDPDTYSRTVVSLSQRQTLVSEVSNAVALNFLDLYSFGLHRKEKKQPCICAAHRADSVSADKPNWVLMSASWGNVPGLILMAIIGHLLPSVKPQRNVNWMIPRYCRTHDWWKNKLSACSDSNSSRDHASLMSSLLLRLFDATPWGERIAALDQTHYSTTDWMYAVRVIISWKIRFRL